MIWSTRECALNIVSGASGNYILQGEEKTTPFYVSNVATKIRPIGTEYQTGKPIYYLRGDTAYAFAHPNTTFYTKSNGVYSEYKAKKLYICTTDNASDSSTNYYKAGGSVSPYTIGTEGPFYKAGEEVTLYKHNRDNLFEGSLYEPGTKRVTLEPASVTVNNVTVLSTPTGGTT